MHQRVPILSGALAALLLLSACNGAPVRQELPADAPAWVRNPESGKRAGEITGLGSADSTGDAAADNRKARDRARDELLRSIMTEIQSTFFRRIHERQEGGEVVTDVNTVDSIVTKTRGELPANLKEDAWYDQGNRRHYLMVSVDKSELLYGLKRSLERALSEANGHLQQTSTLAESSDPLSALPHLRKCEAALPRILMLEAQVVGLGHGATPEVDATLALRNAVRANIQSKATFSLDALSGNERLLAAASETLAALGYQRTDASHAFYHCSVSGEPKVTMTNQGTMKLATATIQANLQIMRASGSGQGLTVPLVSEAGEPLRAVALGSQEEARSRALQELGTHLSASLKRALESALAVR